MTKEHSTENQPKTTQNTGFNNSQMQQYREKKGDLDISSENEPYYKEETDYVRSLMDSDTEYQERCKKLLDDERSPF